MLAGYTWRKNQAAAVRVTFAKFPQSWNLRYYTQQLKTGLAPKFRGRGNQPNLHIAGVISLVGCANLIPVANGDTSLHLVSKTIPRR